MPISRERLSQGGHWLASSSLWSLKNVSRSPLFPCQDPWFDSFFLLLNFLSSPHIYSLYFPFFGSCWDMKTYLEKGKKSVNNKSSFHWKVSSCAKEGLFHHSKLNSTKKTERALFLSLKNTHFHSTWKPIEQKSCSVNDKSAL